MKTNPEDPMLASEPNVPYLTRHSEELVGIEDEDDALYPEESEDEIFPEESD